MKFVRQKITIIEVRKPSEANLNEQLQWLATSLGLFTLRDRNKSCFRIFITLLRNTKQKRVLTSDQIAEMLDLSRGTVIYHINNLLETGLVMHDGNSYMLRVDKLSDLINEVEKDIQRTLGRLKEVAEMIDNRLS